MAFAGCAVIGVGCVSSGVVAAASVVVAAPVVPLSVGAAVVGAAGSVAAGVVGAVPVDAAVVVGAAAVVEGSVMGVPIWSLTTGADANGSVGLWLTTDVPPATTVWVSLTTGTLCLIALRTIGLFVRVKFAAFGVCACVFASGGSGATAWSLGTRSSGIGKLGTAMFGSAVVGAGIVACRKMAAIGAAYIATSTAKPRPAQ
jgi:hypothetical protein